MIQQRVFLTILFSLTLTVVTACKKQSTTEKPLQLFAAASTADAVIEITKLFTKRYGKTVNTNFASSSVLAKQITAGAPAHIFLSANTQWVNYLEKNKLISPGNTHSLLTNQLAIVAPRGKARSHVTFTKHLPPQALTTGRIAIGDPSHVPAGQYAKQTLVNLGWWKKIRSNIVPTVNVRAALHLAELGEVDWAIVYTTDANASSKVVTVGTIPPNLHKPIRYIVALSKTPHPAAKQLLSFLRSTAAITIFHRAGFQTGTIEAGTL